MHKRGSVFVGCFAVLAVAGAAKATVPWDNPNGSGAFFSWANGGTDNDLFGSPVLIGGNTFVFNPIGFIAEANNGATDVRSDRVFFDLFADPGFHVTAVQIVLFGSYTVAAGSSADVSGSLSVDDIAAGAARSEGGPMQFSPVPPYGAGTGTYQGFVLADLSAGTPWTQIHIEFSTNLIAISVPGSSSTISLDVAGNQVAINIIPAPAGLGVLALGGLLVVRRRRA